MKRARGLDELFEAEKCNVGMLKLIQKRERFTHNSWAHNVREFIHGERNTNYLFIHPSDASSRNLSEGDTARVSVGSKAIELPVRLDEDLLPGTISVPHGWGHQRASGLSIAKETGGANVNIIMPDGPESIEQGSGMSHMNGVIAEVDLA